jgi:hypothetical protein
MLSVRQKRRKEIGNEVCLTLSRNRSYYAATHLNNKGRLVKMDNQKLEELRVELEKFDRSKLTAILREMNVIEEGHKVKKPRPEHGPVKAYTTLVKEYECLMCHSHFSVKHNFIKGEDTACFDKEGKVHVIRLSGKEGELTIKCYTNRCQYCAERIKLWSREYLELKFRALLESTSFTDILSCNSYPERDTRLIVSVTAPEKTVQTVQHEDAPEQTY